MEASVSSNLKHLASNCISLLASTPLCDLRDRDFSKCAIPNAYLCDRDFTKSKFLFFSFIFKHATLNRHLKTTNIYILNIKKLPLQAILPSVISKTVILMVQY